VAQYFEEVSQSMGIESSLTSHEWGNGKSFRDIDGDGLDDLTVVRPSSTLILNFSTGAGFNEVATNIYCPPGSLHLLWVDYDNDGHDDIFLTSYGGVSRLFKNNGDFDFTDVTESSGLPMTSDYSYGASFADYNRNGYLDLYLCRYSPHPDFQNKENALFKNNGDGTFTDVTELAGVGDGNKASFMGVWIDVNNDMLPDLYVINDRAPANTLYQNNGDGTFTDITSTSGSGLALNDPMTATVGDYNNDGYSDIFMSNNGTTANMPPLLLTNNGNSTFTETGTEMGLFAPLTTWGGVWADFDNDGWRDLFYTAAGYTGDYFFLNEGGATFTHLPSESTFPATPSYTCAKGDFNADGYADIIVGNLAPVGVEFYKNLGGEANYIKINLEGTVSNRNAIGARVRIQRGAELYHHFTQCGENFVGQDSQTMIFGLGNDAAAPDTVSVTYPSGHTDIYTDLSINDTHSLTEGETYAVSIETQGTPALCSGDTLELDAGEHNSYLWNTGDTARIISVHQGGSYEVMVTSPHGITAVDQVTIQAYPEISITETLQHPKCFETPTGEIALNNQTGTEIAEVVWQSGLSGAEIDSLFSGSYAYTVTDANGCQAEGLIMLTDPPELLLIVFVNPEVNGEDGSIFITVFGGTPPYQITINGEEAGFANESLSGGDYLISVADTLGCTVEYQAELGSTLSMDNASRPELSVYPNPTRGIIHIQGDSSTGEWKLLGIAGRILKTARGGAKSMDISHLAAGVYTMQYALNDGEVNTFKIVKQ